MHDGAGKRTAYVYLRIFPGKIRTGSSPRQRGEITLFVFCDGFAPFKRITEAPDFGTDNDGDGSFTDDCDDSDADIYPGRAGNMR